MTNLEIPTPPKPQCAHSCPAPPTQAPMAELKSYPGLPQLVCGHAVPVPCARVHRRHRCQRVPALHCSESLTHVGHVPLLRAQRWARGHPQTGSRRTRRTRLEHFLTQHASDEERGLLARPRLRAPARRVPERSASQLAQPLRGLLLGLDYLNMKEENAQAGAWHSKNSINTSPYLRDSLRTTRPGVEPRCITSQPRKPGRGKAGTGLT